MSDANHNVQKVYNDLAEYFFLDDSLAGLNDRSGELQATFQAKIAGINRDMNAMIHRQDEIARKLESAFSSAKAILWRRAGKDHVVRHVYGGLEIERLYGPRDLAEPRVFSDDAISEAALFAAAEQVDAEDGFLSALDRLGMLDPGDDRDDSAEWDVVEPIGADELEVYKHLPLNGCSGRTPIPAAGRTAVDQKAS